MTTIEKKKGILHIGSAQKQKIMTVGKLYFAKYPQDKELFEKFNIDSSVGKVFIAIESKENIKKSFVDSELERLGCRILSEKEIKENKPFQYSYPVSEAKQQKILQKLKNETLIINEQEIADIIGCGKRTISSVINGRSIFKNKAFKNRLDRLVKITNMLLGIIKEEELPQWIRRKLKDLNGKRPLELLMNGEVEELYVWAYAELEGRYQ